MQLFDPEETFGDDYLHFYLELLDAERNQADTDRVVETLALEPGDRVLDAPCGHGRLANLLAERGMSVTGVDAAGPFLVLARRGAEERDVEVEYREGDLRDLGVEGPYDAVVCWFTSFGYFDDDGNQDVLAEFARVLRPGGKLGVETLHHDGFVRRFTAAPFTVPTFKGDDVMIDSSRFDPVTGRVITDRVVYRDGSVRRSQHRVRLPTIPELDRWLADAGFSERRFLGSGESPPTVDDLRMVVIATL